jgi:hypothetical protein
MGQAKGNLDTASQLPERIAEVAPLASTASIAQVPGTADILQKIEDLSRQAADQTSGAPDTVLTPGTNARRTTFLSRPTAPRIGVTVGTTGDSETRCESVQRLAPSASRETAATGVDGSRRLFHTHRPPIHHRPSQQPEIPGRNQL